MPDHRGVCLRIRILRERGWIVTGALVFCLTMTGWCAFAIVVLFWEVRFLKRDVRRLEKGKDRALEDSDPLRR